MINVELFYNAQLTSSLSLRPDIQYFNHPGDHRKNGLATGLRWIIQL
jgi:carbohydrate-selective porin OprB